LNDDGKTVLKPPTSKYAVRRMSAHAPVTPETSWATFNMPNGPTELPGMWLP